ncbi:UDP-glycosyltransferase UGT5-like [Epargyreus clarus]|uniref:UDP-glycosyltransferase UGT5-like n=1 Tax=Epargyreus clarus TaxID=520877 RepID=UPI003C2BBEE1
MQLTAKRTNLFNRFSVSAHPKVLAFFSSGDVLSVAEAIHHGVPMIFLPEFNDQPTNTAAVEESGLGVQIRISDLTKDNLVKKFKIVLDSNFRTRVKILSSAYDDRPLSAMSSAIFWTEFAAQHNVSARHPAADVPLHQYLCLDVFAVIGTFIGITAICVMMLLRLVRIIFIVIRKSGNEKIKTE